MRFPITRHSSPLQAAGPTCHTAHAKHVHLLAISRDVCVRFEPIHLRFISETIRLRDEYVVLCRADLHFSAPRSGGLLIPRHWPEASPDSNVNPMCRMPLLRRRTAVRFQNAVDKFLQRSQFRLRSFRNLLLRWQWSPSACRTIRRCTPNVFATARMVPTPCSYSRRIPSNSSTFALLSNRTSVPACYRRNRFACPCSYKVGPVLVITLGPVQISEHRGACPPASPQGISKERANPLLHL
jgi:hypothetical protein